MFRELLAPSADFIFRSMRTTSVASNSPDEVSISFLRYKEFLELRARVPPPSRENHFSHIGPYPAESPTELMVEG